METLATGIWAGRWGPEGLSRGQQGHRVLMNQCGRLWQYTSPSPVLPAGNETSPDREKGKGKKKNLNPGGCRLTFELAS